jgi:Protein of unknown function (DUF3761)
MREATRLATALMLVAFALAGGAGARGDVPPGATARCNDSTYSFSRSGTCSQHGGVAKWTAAGPIATHVALTSVGATVRLRTPTRVSGCTLGALPDRRCSPGAYYSALATGVICAAGFRTGEIRNVPVSEKHAVESAYGMRPASYGSTLEIDHIVSLELGGSNDVANLFPERAPGYHAKDKLENRMHDMVCSGEISLTAAQHQIAADWEALYRRVFGVTPKIR